MRTNLVQKKVTDKNGRQTTVYVRPDHVASTSHTGVAIAPTKVAQGKEEFFADSVARDSQGALLTLWHGSASSFDTFSEDYIGRGNDAWGNGHYFTTEKETAASYGDTVQSFHVNVTNPIFVDGKEHMSLNEVEIADVEQIEQILSGHPDIFRQPDDEEGMNPLGDYIPEFWDKDHHTESEMRSMIRELAVEHFADRPNYVNLEGFYGREHGAEFVKHVHAATGHDGVLVDFQDEDTGKFVVAWFSDQMKSTSNENPTESANIHE